MIVENALNYTIFTFSLQIKNFYTQYLQIIKYDDIIQQLH